MTQKQLILNYLEGWYSITPYEAFRDLGITKLSTRIGELIKQGYDIEKETVHDVNRWGKPIVYMRYRLKKTEKTA